MPALSTVSAGAGTMAVVATQKTSPLCRYSAAANCAASGGSSIGVHSPFGRSERVVSFARLETRKACFAVTLFHAAKECSKGFIKASQYVLQYLAVNLVQFGT